MFRLAHLSDIHLGPLPRVRRRDLMSKRITGYINWRRNRAKAMGNAALALVLDDMEARNPDHIAVTGDLVNLSLDEEIRAGRRWLEGLGEARDVSFVPGNHDAYVVGALDRTIRELRGFMSSEWQNEGLKPFPFLRVRGDVALIGVNSARATPAFVAAGHFSQRQGDALAAILAETGGRGLCRVVMIHHPPVRGAAAPSKRLFGIGRFQEVIGQSGAELILHGHTHLQTVHSISGAGGPVPVVGVAAAGQMPGGRRPAAGWNEISIARAGENWSVKLERRVVDDACLSVQAIETLDLSPGVFTPRASP
jgi:3',5'-cyclic AMP phosphodiesterase CpdA